MTKEIWKPIPDFKDLYLSNLGNCKRKDRLIKKDVTRYRVGKEGKMYTLHVYSLMKELFPDSNYQEYEPTEFQDLEGEEWRDIPGKGGLYQVSNMSRARRLDSYRSKGTGSVFIKGGICSLSINNRGYLVFGVCNEEGNPRAVLLHQVVAKAFVPNPDNLPEINHEDGNKLNCSPSNLKWCTTAYNIQHAWDTGLRKRKLKT